jgi:putative tryptophan/tyrosine transport system substrate-binding protein
MVARAQQPGRIRRIGVLVPNAADDRLVSSRFAAFRRGMQEFGWLENRNLEIDYRFFGGDPKAARTYAAELLARSPDALMAHGSPALKALSETTRTLPIIFVSVVDPVGSGVVESLSKPGGNATGFTLFEYSIAGKWLELLKEIAPQVARVAVLRDTTGPGGPAQFGVLQALAPSFRVELVPVSVQDSRQIEEGVSALARKSDGGLVVLPSGPAANHRKLILTLAAQHSLPAIYPYSYFVADGGLITYGPDIVDQYRRAAAYVARILKGEKPADLPVQSPTKYELAINLKTAKALGLTVPPSLLARADEVIE